ncbi:uncharacterized protein METZ01_LOCUS205813, partial [marine metagenome]
VKKLFLLLILSFFSAQSFAGSCPDGSDPVKSISDDGTYFVYNCEEQAPTSSVINSKAGTVKVSNVNEKIHYSGNWLESNDGLPFFTPHYAKFQLVFTEISKSYTATNFAVGDFDGDGVQDIIIVTNPKMPGVVWDLVGPGCDTSKGACYSKQGSISMFLVDKTPTKLKDGKYTSAMYHATDVSGLLATNNPVEMDGRATTDTHVADFNGDGKLDIFATDTGQIDGSFAGKNDIYFLSNEGPGWTESTPTHITGKGVKKGKGLINFSHGSTIGDIDGDGDIDIVVTSVNWHHSERGEIFCYVNQGDGHMKVRKCGKQWGKTAALGDMDGDGDLDLVWGSETMPAVKTWNRYDVVSGCDRGKATKKCTGAFNGILLNNGKGKFIKRYAEFEDAKSSTGFYYYSVPSARVSDLDGDGDLDVVRMHVGHVYAGAGMTIEENLGNGKFKTAYSLEICPTPTSKDRWPTQEGNEYNCWASDFKFGDFNKDGLVDIYLDGHNVNKSKVVKDGAILLSNGKFNY